jgi:hypothetical protein
LILEIAKGEIEALRLAACQADAGEGLYAETMGGFVKWIAPRYDDAVATLKCRVSKYRAQALVGSAHARTPEIVANLQAGFESFLDFAVDSNVIDTPHRDRLAERCWNSLGAAAGSQSKHQAAMEPTAKFLAVLRSVLASGRAHLASRSGGIPDRNPSSCGWRADGSGNWSAAGECIGWVHERELYLEPTSAFRAVQTASSAAGEPMAISDQVLKKRLHEKELLASTDERRETLTVRRAIAGLSRNVLHFLRATVLPEASDADEETE